MIVVSDTSPLIYLVLIRADHVLPLLFGHVVAPPQVLIEMQHAKAPSEVRTWAATPPAWLDIRSPATPAQFGRLGPGESAAISLAQEIAADAILIDERDGTVVARQLGLNVAGTLNILDLAAERGLLSLSVAIQSLRKTTFRMPEDLVAFLLEQDQLRHSSPPSSWVCDGEKFLAAFGSRDRCVHRIIPVARLRSWRRRFWSSSSSLRTRGRRRPGRGR